MLGVFAFQSGPAVAQVGSDATSEVRIEAPTAKRSIKAEFRSEIGARQSDLNDGKDSVSTENYIGASIGIGKAQKIAFRQVFLFDYAENADQNNVHLGNTYISHSAAEVVRFSESVALGTSTRLYLPTGEKARFHTKEFGRIRNYLNLIRKIGRVSVGANLLSQWNANTQDSWDKIETKDGVEKISQKANEEFYFRPYADISYDITDEISLSQRVGTENTYMRMGESDHLLDLWTSISWKALKDLSFTLAYEADTDIGTSMKNQVGLYRPEDTYTYLIVSASL